MSQSRSLEPVVRSAVDYVMWQFPQSARDRMETAVRERLAGVEDLPSEAVRMRIQEALAPFVVAARRARAFAEATTCVGRRVPIGNRRCDQCGQYHGALTRRRVSAA